MANGWGGGQDVSLFGRHAQGPVNPDDFAIEVFVFHNMSHQGGIFSRATQASGVGNGGGQGSLHFLGKPHQHGRFKDARRNRHDTNAITCQIASGRYFVFGLAVLLIGVDAVLVPGYLVYKNAYVELAGAMLTAAGGISMAWGIRRPRA